MWASHGEGLGAHKVCAAPKSALGSMRIQLVRIDGGVDFDSPPGGESRVFADQPRAQIIVLLQHHRGRILARIEGDKNGRVMIQLMPIAGAESEQRFFPRRDFGGQPRMAEGEMISQNRRRKRRLVGDGERHAGDTAVSAWADAAIERRLVRENRARIVAVSIERFGIDRGGDEIAGGIVKPSVRDVVAIKIERRLLSAREKKARAVLAQKIDFARVGQGRSGARAPHLLEAVHL